MKKRVFTKGTTAVVCGMMLVTVTMLSSCASDFSGDDSQVSSTYEDMKLRSDLKEFATEYEDLYTDAMVVRQSKGNDSEEYVAALQKVGNCIDGFKNKHDLLADLSVSQRASLAVSADSLKLMKLDQNVMMDYIKKNKSEEFYEIMQQFREDGTISVSVDDIIDDDELYTNEKFMLLTMLPPLHATNTIASNVVRSKSGGLTTYSNENTQTKSKQQKCLDTYNSARDVCLARYLAECAMGCCGGNVLLGGVSVAYATYCYYECEDNAHTNYTNCLK